MRTNTDTAIHNALIRWFYRATLPEAVEVVAAVAQKFEEDLLKDLSKSLPFSADLMSSQSNRELLSRQVTLEVIASCIDPHLASTEFAKEFRRKLSEVATQLLPSGVRLSARDVEEGELARWFSGVIAQGDA